jgi:hypothetical protein
VLAEATVTEAIAAALGARADPGPLGSSLPSRQPPGAGSRCAGIGGARPAAVAASRDRSAGGVT